MANNSYIIPKVFPTVEEIDTTLRKVMNECFPGFKISEPPQNDQTGWLIKHPENEDLAFTIHFDEFRDEKALSIPHRHCYEVMWWVEHEIRERLAKAFNAKQYDEGIGAVKNAKVYFDTYSDYLTATYPERFRHVKLMMAKEEAYLLPADIRGKLGKLFE